MNSGRKIKNLLSGTFIIAGVMLIVSALFLEGERYPWQTIFSFLPSKTHLEDPPPIILKGIDKNSALEEYTEDSVPNVGISADLDILPGEESDVQPPAAYIRLGIIKIPKLGVSEHILEGTERQLLYGVGHLPGTAGIGEKGNCVLAGHRYAGFRYIDKLTTGDRLILKAGEALYSYLVFESMVVLPEETWVLSSIEGEGSTLTLITCTPYLVSTHRLVVRARLITANDIPQ